MNGKTAKLFFRIILSAMFLLTGFTNLLSASEYPPYTDSSVNSGFTIKDNPFRYSGYYRDSESGLFYCKARYYSAATMAFTSRDTYNLPNRYGYCDANPVNSIDPDGHQSIGDFAGNAWNTVSGYISDHPVVSALVGTGLLCSAGSGVLLGKMIRYKMNTIKSSSELLTLIEKTGEGRHVGWCTDLDDTLYSKTQHGVFQTEVTLGGRTFYRNDSLFNFLKELKDEQKAKLKLIPLSTGSSWKKESVSEDIEAQTGIKPAGFISRTEWSDGLERISWGIGAKARYLDILKSMTALRTVQTWILADDRLAMQRFWWDGPTFDAGRASFWGTATAKDQN